MGQGCGASMLSNIYSFIYLTKNVQPQFEDYTHACKELQMCARDTAIQLWS